MSDSQVDGLDACPAGGRWMDKVGKERRQFERENETNLTSRGDRFTWGEETELRSFRPGGA